MIARPELSDIELESLKRRGFSDEDIDRAERFGRTVAALYGYVEVEGGVMVGERQGTLCRAFSEECLVLLTRGKATESHKGGKPYVPMQKVHPDEVRPAGRKG